MQLFQRTIRACSVFVAVGFIASLADVRPLCAQTRVMYVAETLRTPDSLGGVVRFLRDLGTKSSASEIDALGDALLTIVMNGRTNDADSLRVRRKAAMLALSMSGVERAAGTIYRGAQMRITQLAQRAPVLSDRKLAMQLLALMPDHDAAVRDLRAIAISRDTLAYHAVVMLNSELQLHGGVEALRMVWVQNLARHRAARRELDTRAREWGWVR